MHNSNLVAAPTAEICSDPLFRPCFVTIIFFLWLDQWHHVQTTGQQPKARQDHSFCAVGKKLVLAGGYDADIKVLTSIHVFIKVVHYLSICYS